MANVLIAGAGVAGSSLAIMLGRAGFSVELFEQSMFPREKACGEGLMPAGVAVLERLGLADAVGGRPYYGVRYYAGDSVATGRFPATGGQTAVGRGQRRYHLDRVLFEAAAATPGVVAHTHARVEAPLVRHGRVVGLRVAGNEHMASLVVAADGAHSRLRHQLGLDGRPTRHPRIGLRAHFRLLADVTQPPWVEIFLGKQSELYVTPLSQGEVLVAALFTREMLTTRPVGLLQQLIEAQPVLRARLMGAQQITAVKGMAPLTIRPRARHPRCRAPR
ncbi:MAG: FAD-dependent monooxygenase [Chloroflexota bacterium]|nr:FAD-dependent monooxygenase [Chloroflexota bacterium]